MADPFEDISGFKSAEDAFRGAQTARGLSDKRYVAKTSDQDVQSTIDQYARQFQTQFQNYVGRPPTDDEINTFFEQIGTQAAGSKQYGAVESPNMSVLRDQTKGFISDTFQQQAKDQASKQLQDQMGQAAGLADQFRGMGRAAISTTAQTLADYAQKVFKQIEPDLLTSLQAKGLLNTGGLNEAVAGVQGDLANQNTAFLANASLNNENQANQIAFGGASAPYYYNQAAAMNTVPTLQEAGRTGLQNYETALAQETANDQQIRMARIQDQLTQDAQPGLFQRFSQNFVGNAGSAMGSSWGGFMGPPKDKNAMSMAMA